MGAKRRRKPYDGHVVPYPDRERTHCVSCDAPEPGLMCETVRGVGVAFYYYCARHWYARAADGGPSAAGRTGVDVPTSELLEQLSHARSLIAHVRDDAIDYEKRWIAECRAHGDTRRALWRAQCELGDHSNCEDCGRERSLHEPDNDGF